MFPRLLWESFRRQKRRKALAAVAILLGTTAVSAMLALATTIGDRIHQELAVYGANLVLTPKAAGLAVKIGDVDVQPASGDSTLHERDLDKLRTIFWANNITGVSPEHQVDGYSIVVPDDSHLPVKFTELWFDHDLHGLRTGAPSLHPWWKLQGHWPVRQRHDDFLPVVLGVTLAQRLGYPLPFTASAHYPPLQLLSPAGTPLVNVLVTGIVSAGDATDSAVLAPLPFADQLNGDPIDRVDIAARTRPEDAFARQDPDQLSPSKREIWYCRPYANSIAYQIREAIPGADARQVRRVEQTEGTLLRRISGLMWLVSAAALLAAGFAVSAAMASAVLERRGEIGLMRSLGAGRSAIAAFFYAESSLLAVGAGTLGFLLGSALAWWLGRRIFLGQAVAAGPSGAMLNWVLLPVVVALAVAVALAGSTPAIRRALAADPSHVLRGAD